MSVSPSYRFFLFDTPSSVAAAGAGRRQSVGQRWLNASHDPSTRFRVAFKWERRRSHPWRAHRRGTVSAGVFFLVVFKFVPLHHCHWHCLVLPRLSVPCLLFRLPVSTLLPVHHLHWQPVPATLHPIAAASFTLEYDGQGLRDVVCVTGVDALLHCEPPGVLSRKLQVPTDAVRCRHPFKLEQLERSAGRTPVHPLCHGTPATANSTQAACALM
jgi:hypothetical protein